MLQDSKNEIILSLADILKGQHVSQEAILKALGLICNHFSFDSGVIYETDFSDHFCLMEYFTRTDTLPQGRYPASAVSPQDQPYLAQRPITSMARSAENTPLETQLLDLCHAQALVFLPVVDEHWTIYGFVVFLNHTLPSPQPPSDFHFMAVALSMLVRYAGIRMYQKKLGQAQATLERIMDNAGVDIYVNDFYNHDILYTNASMAAPYGGKEKFVGKKCWQVLFPGQGGPCEFCPQKKLIDENGVPTKVYSWDYQRAFDGSWFRVFSSAFHWVDGRLAHVVSSADITGNKRNEALIENLANYDQLTQLPNRRSLIRDCERRIQLASAIEQGYLLFFDIDGFKTINDSYGHDAGDEFLVQLGAFFSGIPLLKDSIYRNGGDEFVAVVGGETISKEHVAHLAHFIHARFEKPWQLSYGPVCCSTSIGVSCYPQDGTTAQELLQKADAAMYQVKKSGGGGVYFYTHE